MKLRTIQVVLLEQLQLLGEWVFHLFLFQLGIFITFINHINAKRFGVFKKKFLRAGRDFYQLKITLSAVGNTRESYFLDFRKVRRTRVWI